MTDAANPNCRVCRSIGGRHPTCRLNTVQRGMSPITALARKRLRPMATRHTLTLRSNRPPTDGRRGPGGLEDDRLARRVARAVARRLRDPAATHPAAVAR